MHSTAVHFNNKISIGELAREFYRLLVQPDIIVVNGSTIESSNGTCPPFSWINDEDGWQLLVAEELDFYESANLFSIGILGKTNRLNPYIDTCKFTEKEYFFVNRNTYLGFNESIEKLLEIYPGRIMNG